MKEFKYLEIYHAIIRDIEQGFLKYHDKIPSIRQMTKKYNVSKTTVETAYQQLLSEGYIESREKVGYFVATLASPYLLKSDQKPANHLKQEHYRYDFSGRCVDDESFNIDIWRRYIKKALHETEDLMSYGEPCGEWKLRCALQKYSQDYRGVRRNKENYVVGAGFQTLLYHVCSLFDKNVVVAMEIGGFQQAEAIFHDCHMQVVKIPVDNEGIIVEKLKESHASIVYINSSSGGYHGHPIKMKRRQEIMEYARKYHVYIIEDDHNGELKFNTKPMDAMTKYENQWMIYIGSFSKLLLPSIRISYMALPDSLLVQYQEKIQYYHQTASKLEQLALASYMEDGQLARHLKKLRKHYYKKGNELLKLLQEAFPTCSFHLYETALKISMSVASSNIEFYLQTAKEHSICVNKSSNKNEIILSFSSILYQDIKPAVDLLKEIWSEL